MQQIKNLFPNLQTSLRYTRYDDTYGVHVYDGSGTQKVELTVTVKFIPEADFVPPVF